MGTICEANTVVKCDHSGTHNTFIISREHHQVPLRGNIELHREPSSTLELSRRSLTTLLSHCHQPSSYTTIRSPPRNIAASEHTTDSEKCASHNNYGGEQLTRAAREALWRPPLTTLETTYAERCFPLALVPRTARISHTARLLLRPPRKLRGGHPSKCSLERTQCVLVEFRTSLERGEQDHQKLVCCVALRCSPEAPVRNSFCRPRSCRRNILTSLLMASPRGILASDRFKR